MKIQKEVEKFARKLTDKEWLVMAFIYGVRYKIKPEEEVIASVLEKFPDAKNDTDEIIEFIHRGWDWLVGKKMSDRKYLEYYQWAYSKLSRKGKKSVLKTKHETDKYTEEDWKKFEEILKGMDWSLIDEAIENSKRGIIPEDTEDLDKAE